MAVIVAGARNYSALVYRDTDYSQTLWWQFEFSEEVPRGGLRALLGLVLASSTIAIFSLMRPVAYRPDAIEAEDVVNATGIVMKQDAADANLVRMGDKHVMFSESGNAFIMYGIQGRSWIAFADPVGDEEDFLRSRLAIRGSRPFGGRTRRLLPDFNLSCSPIAPMPACALSSSANWRSLISPHSN